MLTRPTQEEEEDAEARQPAAIAQRFGAAGGAAAGGGGASPSPAAFHRLATPPHPLSAARAAAPPPPPAATEWTGLRGFPPATQVALGALLSKAQADGRDRLTLCLLGKPGAGKSSTINSVLGERAAPTAAFGSDTSQPTAFSRTAAGFTLTLIDTPGLVDGDAVSPRALAAVRASCAAYPVDAFLYVDRLDAWRLDSLDYAVFSSLSAHLGGAALWRRTLLVFSHGQMLPPSSVPHAEFVARRTDAVRAAIRSTIGRGGGEAGLPVALVENAGRCAVNASQEKILPDGSPWLPLLLGGALEVATSAGGSFVPPKASSADPNRKGRWAILPLLLLQIFVIRPLVIARIRNDNAHAYDSD